jgi:hypothetical protein
VQQGHHRFEFGDPVVWRHASMLHLQHKTG